MNEGEKQIPEVVKGSNGSGSKSMWYFTHTLRTQRKQTFGASEMFPDCFSSSTPHPHPLIEITCLSSDLEAFSVSLRPRTISCLSVCSHGHCPMTSGLANFHPQGSEFAHSYVSQLSLISVLFCSVSSAAACPWNYSQF